MQMKPGIDMKGGSSPALPWAQPSATIRVAHRYYAPPAPVFDAWLDPGVAGRWLFATASRPISELAIDARVGGSFCFVDRHVGEIFEYAGEYVEILPHRRLMFTLAMERQQVITRVTVEIAPLRKGCTLKLTHDNVRQEDARRIEGRWTGILYGLGVTLDSLSPAFHHHQE
jgi:uncharacterized protein YndB with AHSA1/START domain